MFDVDTAGFMPHGHCYLWQPGILWTHVVSDTVIGLAYFSIPIAIGVFALKRPDVGRLFTTVMAMFIAFIVLCGTTHFINIWTVWTPDYVLEASVKAMTALASIGTALALWPLMPLALRVPSPEELATRNRELQEKHEELTRTNLELGQFAYVASHDLQAPLRRLRLFTEVLERELTQPLSEEGAKALSFIQSESAKMKGLVEDLLEFSRVENRPIDLGMARLDDLARAAADTLESDLAEKGAEIVIEAMGPAREVDPSMIERLFLNLIHNAIEYARPGVPPRVEIGRIDDAQGERFYVRDNGVGIPQAHRARVFDVFQRLDNTGGGTGIGLSICRKVIENHGGRIWIEPSDRPGTTMVFTLGATRDESEGEYGDV